jgi:hypothetical protein
MHNPGKLETLRTQVAPAQEWVYKYLFAVTFQAYGLYIVVMGFLIATAIWGLYHTILDWIIQSSTDSGKSLGLTSKK